MANYFDDFELEVSCEEVYSEDGLCGYYVPATGEDEVF